MVLNIFVASAKDKYLTRSLPTSQRIVETDSTMSDAPASKILMAVDDMDNDFQDRLVV